MKGFLIFSRTARSNEIIDGVGKNVEKNPSLQSVTAVNNEVFPENLHLYVYKDQLTQQLKS